MSKAWGFDSPRRPLHSIWHIFWYASLKSTGHFIRHTFWHFIWHIFWHSIWHTFWQFIWHIGPAVRTGLDRSQIEVQHCPLTLGDGCWGPAAPTRIGSWQLRSSSAVPTAIRSWRGGEEARRSRRRRRRKAWRAIWKSNNPHLAGGEWRGKVFSQSVCIVIAPCTPAL